MMRFGSTAELLLKCKLKYYIIAECAAVELTSTAKIVSVCALSRDLGQGMCADKGFCQKVNGLANWSITRPCQLMKCR